MEHYYEDHSCLQDIGKTMTHIYKNYFTNVKDPSDIFESLFITRKSFSLLSSMCFLVMNLYYDIASLMLLVTEISYWVFID